MFYVVVLVILAAASVANANCDNACSGHGTCMIDDVCQCYDNWGVGLSHDSGDCSDRICPYEIAWVDTPDMNGNFHKYVECAGRGICDRTTGECTCFDGYEGKACARMSCPNDCSGHGTCEYIDDMGFAATWNDYQRQYFSENLKTFPYYQWDSGKTRGCVCDATYGDVDCSKRLCPYGTDVLDVRENLLASVQYQVQELRFIIDDPSLYPPSSGYVELTKQQALKDGASPVTYAKFNTKTFALTFKSRLNETFTTIPINFDTYDLNDLVHDIQLALLNLPNRVIDGITVAASVHNENYNFGVPDGNAASKNTMADTVIVNVTFTGPAVQGPQHLLVVEDYECYTGCTPMITGLPLQTQFNRYSSNVTEVKLADYNSYECGRRGVCDYTTGLCNCFVGYTGDNCNTLTTLV